MHVVHICKVLGIAGAERHLLGLLPGLAARGVDVLMMVMEDPQHPVPEFCAQMEERGVNVEQVAIRSDLDPSLLFRLTERLRELAPDMVHTHLIHADLYGLAAARRADVHYAVSSRHNDNPFRHNLIIKAANRISMGQADRVIVISNALAKFVQEVEGISEEDVVTIHYGLAPDLYQPSSREAARTRLGVDDQQPVIGMFGRLIRQKGVDVLLRAFTLNVKRCPDARLVIVGDGDLREQLQALTNELQIDCCVTFTGWVEDAPALMPGCDIIAMPSRWEGFGLVALEAMFHKRPLVTSKISALPEIVVHEETGLLVAPDDPAALFAALDRLLNDREEARQFGQAGFSRLNDMFTVDRMVDQTLQVYQTVVDSTAESS